ncbi:MULTISPECIES: adenylosuccinate lyase [unclassified Campylobacter]|uniref:adenylosuccinate lyase n=1 Tax=unclassified Campylobacter TaxID=2593542 RepID=UPI00123829AB|nr:MULTISPECIES: adenylosuccinate lyase [unclassified Campylobacter]KAA6224755.1 adenylosuccinate lyase [Campylobacter sp. LR185c]KAA6225752.1 adenylosuccinate lyase [Campylobacter sp. LR286c]KAA6229725.1 adenylosuccinate lyase [Campylobacter sp. LR291e]KAA8604030.1 adenylosuccinate lyase [Campylobacter sp. LR185c]
MQIVQTLESLNVNTDDISLFHYFKDLIIKNFSKVVGRKDKVFSFFDESEIPQRRYFLKLLNQKFKKLSNENIENLNDAHLKTFKLNFKQENMLKPMLFIKVSFAQQNILMKLSSNEKIFLTYMRNYFKNHLVEYDESTKIAMLKYNDEITFELFEAFADESEHLKYCVDFCIDSKEYKDFRDNIHKKENMKWKFNALAKLFNNYFNILECTPQNDLSEIRQKYLVMVKLYHPDFHQDKSAIEKAYCREQFEKIQIAYDNLKALYKNNA